MKTSSDQGQKFCEALDNMVDGSFVAKYDEHLLTVVQLLFEEIYGIVGYDWISWFIYEKDGRKDMKAQDKNGKEICRNENELWKMLENEYKVNSQEPTAIAVKQSKKWIKDLEKQQKKKKT